MIALAGLKLVAHSLVYYARKGLAGDGGRVSRLACAWTSACVHHMASDWEWKLAVPGIRLLV